MPIEFQCPACEQMLRVADSVGGRQARCPHCGTVSVVEMREPIGSAKPAVPGDLAEPKRGAATNPYAAPAALETAVDQAHAQPMQPGRVRMGEVIALTLSRVRHRWGACVLLSLALMGLFFGSGVLQMALQWMVAQLTAANPRAFEAIALVVGAILVYLGQFVVQAIVTVVMTQAGVNIVRNAPAADRVLGTLPVYLRVFVWSILQWILIMLPGALIFAFLTPLQMLAPPQDPTVTFAVTITIGFLAIGVMLNIWLRLFLVPYFLVDQRQGIFASIGQSNAFMRGNKLATLASLIVAGVLALLFAVVTLMLGLLILLGSIAVLWGVIYGLATSQVGAGRQSANDAISEDWTEKPLDELQDSSAAWPGEMVDR